jgi:protein SCO1
MSLRRAAFAVSAALAVTSLAGGCSQAASERAAAPKPVAQGRIVDRFRGTPVLAGTIAQDFALRDQDGEVIRLSAQQGHAVLLTFLYTRCPDVCPLLAENLNAVLNSLGAKQRSRVRVIAVSVDPAHDTPRTVRAFVKSHGLLPQFHYLVGPKNDLKPIWQAYNLVVEVQNVERVTHSAYVLLIDRAGKPRFYYPPTVGAAALLHDLRRLGRS